MPNPYVNKVTANNVTLIDLTADTAVASDVAAGKYFHLATGERVVGTVSGGGGDSYTRTIVVPEQTVTPNSDRLAYVTNTDWYAEGEMYIVTLDGTEYATRCTNLWTENYSIGSVAWYFGVNNDVVYPFGSIYAPLESGEVSFAFSNTSSHTIKVEHLEFIDGPLNLITKSIIQNGTYNASSDNADGYSSVTVNVPSGGSNDFIVTLAKNSQTDEWEPDCTYAEAAAAASAGKSIVVDADVPSVDATADGEWNDFLQYLEYWVHQYYDSANGGIVETQYRLTANGLIVQGTTTYVTEPTGSMTITQNGTGIDVAQYASVDVAVPTGGGSSIQTATGTFTGNGTRTIDISSVTFEPDLVYFTSDPGTTASSGTVAAIIVRGLMTATRYRNNSTTNSHYAIPGIANLNTSGSSYSWRATYDSTNSKLTLYCYSSNARGLLTSGRTYTYTLIKWT